MHGSNEDLNVITQGNSERDCPLSERCSVSSITDVGGLNQAQEGFDSPRHGFRFLHFFSA